MPPGRPKGSTTRTSAFIKFAVSGRGVFPIDMLRYDACWPLRGEDVHQIELPSTELRNTQDRIIWLKTSGRVDPRPTKARWASFGWHVITIEKADA